MVECYDYNRILQRKRPELWSELDYNIQEERKFFDFEAAIAKLGKGKSRYQIHERNKKGRKKHGK